MYTYSKSKYQLFESGFWYFNLCVLVGDSKLKFVLKIAGIYVFDLEIEIIIRYSILDFLLGLVLIFKHE